MDIIWYGHSCFRLMERGTASIITDPYDESLGYPLPRLKGDVVTVSHDAPGHNAVETVKGVQHVLTSPGEYEIGGIFLTGVATYDPAKLDSPTLRHNIIFVYNFGDLTVCHLGDLDYIPKQAEIEALGPIDVLLVPVGGGGALTSGQAGEMISLIEPSIVVPMHYHTGYTSLSLDPLDRFIKEIGLSSYEEVETLKVSKSSLNAEDTQIVVMKPAN